jgi:NADPH-dependent 2,4-dienoyl-CoA reductase/sulfur reductase-like enzyme
MDRRDFLNILAASSLSLMTVPFLARAEDSDVLSELFPVPTNTGITGNIVIVGGGMAGATLSKYLRLWGGTGVHVTLIEKAPSYTSNIMSNTVLNGQRSMADLNYVYDTLRDWYGVNVVQGEVTAVDSANKTVTYSGGTLSYGRLVMAPGLEFDLLPGVNSKEEYETLIPHAWKAGPQTTLLRNQLLELQNGERVGDVVISIPKAPYRCPPGPYERACVIADWLYTHNINSKVIVLDANADILVEKDNFSYAFGGAYGYVVDYRPGCSVTAVESSSRTVSYTRKNEWGETVSDTITAGILNPIPPQRAPQLLADAGLLNATGFAPVNVLSYESTAIGKSGIHIIGDASSTSQPKAGHIANQEAKTCADAILRLLKGQSLDTAPVTNSACFTPITATTATWLSAVYQYKFDSVSSSWKMMASTENGKTQPLAAPRATSDNYEDMIKWFNTLMADSFA